MGGSSGTWKVFKRKIKSIFATNEAAELGPPGVPGVTYTSKHLLQPAQAAAMHQGGGHAHDQPLPETGHPASSAHPAPVRISHEVNDTPFKRVTSAMKVLEAVPPVETSSQAAVDPLEALLRDGLGPGTPARPSSCSLSNASLIRLLPRNSGRMTPGNSQPPSCMNSITLDSQSLGRIMSPSGGQQQDMRSLAFRTSMRRLTGDVMSDSLVQGRSLTEANDPYMGTRKDRASGLGGGASMDHVYAMDVSGSHAQCYSPTGGSPMASPTATPTLHYKSHNTTPHHQHSSSSPSPASSNTPTATNASPPPATPANVPSSGGASEARPKLPGSVRMLYSNPASPAAMQRPVWNLDDFKAEHRLHKGSYSAVYKVRGRGCQSVSCLHHESPAVHIRVDGMWIAEAMQCVERASAHRAAYRHVDGSCGGRLACMHAAPQAPSGLCLLCAYAHA